MYIKRKQTIKKIIRFYSKKPGYRLTVTFFLGYLFLLIMEEFLAENLVNTIAVILIAIISMVIVNLVRNVRSRKERFAQRTLEEVDGMTGVQFELMLGKLFESKGYHVTMTKASGDFGVDLIIQYRKDKIAVQTKRYSGAVGIEAVQQVISGMKYYRCNHAMVVTNSRFTPSAFELARSARVELWDRKKLGRETKGMEYVAESVPEPTSE